MLLLVNSHLLDRNWIGMYQACNTISTWAMMSLEKEIQLKRCRTATAAYLCMLWPVVLVTSAPWPFLTGQIPVGGHWQSEGKYIGHN